MKNNLNESLPFKPLKELSMGMSNDYEIAIEESNSNQTWYGLVWSKELT